MTSAGGAFGYNFHHDNLHDHTPSETIPPVGAPLLADSDASYLNDFFSADPATTYFPPDFPIKDDSVQRHHSIYYEPPPTVHSVTAAVNGSSQTAPGFTGLDQHGNSTYTNVNDFMIPQATSDDVFGAASALVGHSGGSQGYIPFNESMHPGQGAVMSSLRGSHARQSSDLLSSAYYHPALATTSPVNPPSTANAAQLPLGLFPIDDGDTSFKFRYNHHGHQPLYGFGSDSHFNANGFIPFSERETDDAVTSRLVSNVRRGMIGPPSGDNTQTSSPVRREQLVLSKESSQDHDHDHDHDHDRDSEEEAPASRTGAAPRPPKRRKSTHPKASPTSAEFSSSRAHPVPPTGAAADASKDGGGKPRRPSQPGASSSSSSKRRKSSPAGGAGAKPPRQNLTESEKRSNHILSEQKRRNAIKHGFEELHRLVPELRAGGYSKSNVLVEAANWIEELGRGNRALRERLGPA